MNSKICTVRKWYAIFTALTIVALCGITTFAASSAGKTFISSGYDITSMTCDENYLWAGTLSDGLLRIDKTSGETVIYPVYDSITTSNSIRTLTFDSEGTLFAGTPRYGILRFTDTRCEQLNGLSDSTVTGLTIDNTGTIWAKMAHQGIVRRTDNGWNPVVDEFQGEMTRSPDGSIWLLKTPPGDAADCSNGWIRKYGADGEVQKTISLEPACIYIGERNLFAVDGNDNCWIFSGDYLLKINGDDFTKYTVSNTTEHKSINAIAVSPDNIILFAERNYSTQTNCLYLHDPTSTGEPLGSCISATDVPAVDRACADEENGGFWCATLGGTIIRIDDSGNVSTLPKNNAVLPANAITSLLTDTSDDIWVATNTGIARYHESSWSHYSTHIDSIPGDDVSSLALDSSGTVWAAFQQSAISSMVVSGLSFFNGKRWSMLERTYNPVRAITVDASGTKWIASDNGVLRYQASEPELVLEPPESKRYLYDPWMNAIAFDDNNTLWLGTNDGIKRYKNDTWVDDATLPDHFPEADDSTGVTVNAIAFNSGAAWIGTNFGLLKCDGDDCERIDTAGGILPDCRVQCITPDGETGVWVGTKGGLVRLNGANHSTYTSENSPLFDNNITACTIAHNGDLCIGTQYGGLTVVTQSAIAVKHDLSPKKKQSLKTGVSFTAIHQRLIRLSITTDRSAAITFSVFSLKGEIVRQFNQRVVNAGTTAFIWDGTDRCNRAVSAGMYLGVVTVNGSIIESKLIALE